MGDPGGRDDCHGDPNRFLVGVAFGFLGRLLVVFDFFEISVNDILVAGALLGGFGAA